MDTGWEDEFVYEMWSNLWLASAETPLSFMWTLCLCILFWSRQSISSPTFPFHSLIIYCRLFSFRILTPNKIHQPNLREPVMRVMIPSFPSSTFLHQKFLRISITNLIRQIRSRRFHIFHRGCLCLHYPFNANHRH